MYVTGIASHQSFDFSTCKKLHTDLYNLLKSDNTKRKTLSPVFQRLPMWLSDANIALGLNAYYKEKDLNKALFFSDEALKYNPISDVAILNKATYTFERGNIAEAKDLIKRLRRQNVRGNLPNSAWRYSEAFLLFLEEKYDAGIKAYKKAFDGYINNLTLGMTTGNISDYLNKNPR